MLFGRFAVPIQPYFQLDAVLAKTELDDNDLTQATLELLKQANG